MSANLLEQIVEDHANMRRLLDLLERELDLVEDADTVDYTLLGQIADYLLDYPDRFHHPIEDRIVDAIVRHNTQAARPAVLYRSEHEELHRHAETFARHVREVAADMPMRRAAFVAEGRRFAHELRDHLDREDRHFLPLARRYLSDEELAAIKAEMPPVDDPLFGNATRQRYGALLAAITGHEANGVKKQVSS